LPLNFANDSSVGRSADSKYFRRRFLGFRFAPPQAGVPCGAAGLGVLDFMLTTAPRAPAEVPAAD
jgi:hypothetical protein